MAAFRKTFLALAAVVTLSGSATTAFAQVTTNTPLTCTVTSVAPYVRSQGLTEQVGDVIVTCTGGSPTLDGQQVPVVNFALATAGNINITSRLLGGVALDRLPAVNGAYPYSEAVLAINDPNPAVPNPVNAPLSTTGGPQLACPASNTGTCFNTGNGTGGGAGTGSSYNTGYNIFQAYQFDNHTLRFDGIPFDAPGTNKAVIFRITNVRVDATPYASAGLANQPITVTLSITGTQPPAINNIEPYVVGFPQNAIVTFANTPVSTGVCNPGTLFTISAQEGFASSFKRQNIAVSTDGVTVPAPAAQNVFGYQYFTESGFYNPVLTYQHPEQTGLASNGTRIWIQVNNVPANVTVTAPLTAYLYGGTTVPTVTNQFPGWLVQTAPPSLPTYNGQNPSGAAHLLHAPSVTGGGPYVPGTSVDATVTGTAASTIFVYEVLFSDPSAIETLIANFTVTYAPGVPTYAVPPAYISGVLSIAPISPSVNNIASAVYGSDLAGATFTDPSDTSIPRFVKTSGGNPGNVYFLTGCQCDLLFPYIVSQAGLETGIAIANTSLDPYGTIPQSGYIQLFFYPDFASSFTPAGPFSQTTKLKLAGGDEFLMVVGGGSSNPGFGITGVPGFQGYLIAVSGFQYCHGYAFIADSQVQKLAEGYVALQLDEPFLPRYGGPGAATGVTPPAYVPGEYLSH